LPRVYQEVIVARLKSIQIDVPKYIGMDLDGADDFDVDVAATDEAVGEADASVDAKLVV
jgi:hypothetical protein